MRVLLITPPSVQWNTPYPATAQLKGFLDQTGVALMVAQDDLSIRWVDRIFSRDGLGLVFTAAEKKAKHTEAGAFFLNAREDYLRTIEHVKAFLRGQDPSFAQRLAGRKLVPEGPRFGQLEQNDLEAAFGTLGTQDRAKYIATLYLDDLSDFIRDYVDPNFQVTRYAEKIAASQPDFAKIETALQAKPTVLDALLQDLVDETLAQASPEVVGLTAPFPGNVLGALKIARRIKERAPETKVIFGGGYANTELRSLADPGIFKYFDFITLDDGERPFLALLEHLKGERPRHELVRTYFRNEKNEVEFSKGMLHDVPPAETGYPTYAGLPLSLYLPVFEVLNPMHRIWSEARWNKLAVAHGCYWKKCSFCDVSLDYIGRYEQSPTDITIERMERLARETGIRGFHFVDEAAPPAALRALSKKLLEKGAEFTWWGNIRFEKTFDAATTQLMADAGCIAVTGGLEVASPRLLKLIDKGVTVEQVARVTRNFQKAGIFVHAYLMYGFPTQTSQETVDSLERVRQLFAAGCLQSAYWHRFSATIHSPIGRNPEKYGIEVRRVEDRKTLFAENDLDFSDPTPCDHDTMGLGLNRALYNFMHGIGLEHDVREWFDVKVPRTTVPRDWVQKVLAEEESGASLSPHATH